MDNKVRKDPYFINTKRYSVRLRVCERDTVHYAGCMCQLVHIHSLSHHTRFHYSSPNHLKALFLYTVSPNTFYYTESFGNVGLNLKISLSIMF